MMPFRLGYLRVSLSFFVLEASPSLRFSFRMCIPPLTPCCIQDSMDLIENSRTAIEHVIQRNNRIIISICIKARDPMSMYEYGNQLHYHYTRVIVKDCVFSPPFCTDSNCDIVIEYDMHISHSLFSIYSLESARTMHHCVCFVLQAPAITKRIIKFSGLCTAYQILYQCA